MSKDDQAPFKTPSMRLDGMIAVVTGAGRGLGRAGALALTAAGAKVVLISLTASDLQRCKNRGRSHIRAQAAIQTGA
jgi:NAD(P)-dependent dehydrogenase (short-subunit alcohol dehydrogenase family)